MLSTQTLARRLIYSMLPWYLLLALGATGVQLAIQYFTVAQTIVDDLASLGRTVRPGVTEAVWELDAARLAAIARGVRQNAIVSGIEIKTEEDDVLVADGDLSSIEMDRDDLFPRQFRREIVPLYHSSLSDGDRLIGHMVLYSDRDVMWNRIKTSFFVVLFNSVVVTTGLWLIFSWTIRRRLSDSVTQVAKTVVDWRFNIGEKQVERINYPHQDELGTLVQAFNDMFDTIETRNRELIKANQLLADSQDKLKSINEELEQRVAARTAELQALFDSASVGIVQMRDRVISRCNRRMDEMFGYAYGEQIGRQTRIWYANEADWIASAAAAEIQIERGETLVHEQIAIRKDGHPFWIRLSARAIDINAPDEGMVGVVEDITIERAAREEMLKAKSLAEEATRMKSEFLANMSHEIRTPMNAILGMLYLALKPDLPPSLHNYLTKAQNAAHSLLGIINDILDFSKIEAGRLEIEEVEFGLDAVLEQLSDAIGFQAEQKGIEFLIRYDPSIPPMLIGDPLRLGQILLNLCGNAIKFTDKGEVELAFRALTATDTSMTMQVCVRDSGIGMTTAAQQKLFEKFSQGDQTTTRRFGGTGLGLAICKQLVELMGGRIWVEDSEPGKGTTISFTIQLKIARQALAHRYDLVEQVGPLLKGIRVLVADDNEVSREIMAEMLRFFRLDVVVVANGAAALTALREAADKPFDLLLLDWRMPGMNGHEVTQRMHQDPAIAIPPKVVMVTAYGREDVIRLAKQAGVNGFLIKPVSPSTLLDTILSVLDRGRILGQRPERQEIPVGLAPSGQLAGARILLVEDNDINREFASELLRGEGMEVDEAINGREAVDKVRQVPYDAVLMDIQMPVMGGLEAARAIRALAEAPGAERYATLPIIAMTALAMAQDAEKSQAAGMNDHVTKPIVPERLLATLVKWMPPTRERTAAGGAVSLRPSPTPEFPLDLAALNSIDAREGVRRIGGKIEAYRRQLRRFREHYPDAASELRRLVTTHDLPRAGEYCHALKGVTGNIGAVSLYEKIIDIDTELKQGATPPESDLEAVDALLQRVMTEIDGLAVPPTAVSTAATPMGRGDIIERLDRLEHALEYDLGAADGLLAELRAGIGETDEPAMREISAKADVFAIDEALALVASLRDRLQSVTGTKP
ncbi:response regulator [Telmatospirillum sp.]|uniref:hybrid sensor histidine kinase/response regulator n=1 Tax=Telmatospirillum sp. TaxID=2079197 RepID=UPI00284762D9|nr:response regulator [Telmatospirillum sp.]MDR3435358.1 response regulator [Telmatospirillum sp.]